MQTFENFVLTDKQKEMFLKSIYNRRYAKYIKEHGMTPVNTDDFYNYTKEDLERYKRAIFSTTLNEEPVISDFEKNLVDEGYKSISKLVSENGVEHTVWTVVAE